MADLTQKLVNLRKKNPHARALFDGLRTYELFMRTTTVDNLSRKSGLTPKEVRGVLKILEGLHLGKLWLGRRESPTRFEWAESFLAVIPGKQPGEPVTLDPAEDVEVKGVGGANATPWFEWVISLGGRRVARVVLPHSVEKDDVLKLRAFCDAYLKELKAAG